MLTWTKSQALSCRLKSAEATKYKWSSSSTKGLNESQVWDHVNETFAHIVLRTTTVSGDSYHTYPLFIIISCLLPSPTLSFVSRDIVAKNRSCWPCCFNSTVRPTKFGLSVRMIRPSALTVYYYIIFIMEVSPSSPGWFVLVQVSNGYQSIK